MRLASLLMLATAYSIGSACAETNNQATAPVPGAAVYAQHCAVCHDRADGRTPTRAYLGQSRSPGYILRALTNGVMRGPGAGLSQAEKEAVATYLAGRPLGEEAEVNPNANLCKEPKPMSEHASSWNGWGGQGVSNARMQANAGLDAADVSRLKLKWAFAYPGGVSSEPTVVGGRIFVGSIAGVLFALDASSGCTIWHAQLAAPIRSMVSIDRLATGKYVAYATDWRANIYAFDADTGSELWRAKADDHPSVRQTGSPTLYDGRLYVPISSGEEGFAADPKYVCCTFRGSLVAFDAQTGRQLWKSYTIDQAARPQSRNKGQMGPSGAAIWSAPTIDTKRRLIYVATGDDYTEPASKASDAVIAYDLDTGKKRWTRQVLAGDVFVGGCHPRKHANCPKSETGPDFDFGASPLLVKTPDGKDRIIALSKGGVAYGLDPDQGGKLLWQLEIGRGGLLGGVEWGGASDGQNVYAAISDLDYAGEPVKSARPAKPGINAISAEGKLIWHTPAPQVPCGWDGPCFNAHLAAVAMIPGVIFAGSWDGHERAYSSATGSVLWDFDTGHSFDAVNGGRASGGAIDHGAQSIADGLLLVNSGGRQGHAGNALLVFSVDGK